MSEKIVSQPEVAELREMFMLPQERFEQAKRNQWERWQSGNVEMLKSWEIRSDEEPRTITDLFPEYFPRGQNQGPPIKREMVIVDADGKNLRYFDINPNNCNYSEYEISEQKNRFENTDPVDGEHTVTKGKDSWKLKTTQIKHGENGRTGDAKIDTVELQKDELLFARNTYRKPQPPLVDSENDLELSQKQKSAFGIVDRCSVQAEASRRREPLNIAVARYFGSHAIEPDMARLEKLEK